MYLFFSFLHLHPSYTYDYCLIPGVVISTIYKNVVFASSPVDCVFGPRSISNQRLSNW